MSDTKSGVRESCELRELLASDFPGAWGSDPGSKQANVSVLRSTNLDDEGHIDYLTGAKRYFASRDLEKKRLSDGDILLEASGGGPGKPVGRVAIFKSPDDEIYASSNFFRTLRPRSIVDSGFLSWYLQWIYQQSSIWQFQQQTTGIINLKYKDYFRQSIRLPEIQEQRRIAEVLDTADEAIRSTERLIAKLEQTKSGLVHGLLTCGIDESGHLRDPIRHPHQFVCTPVGLLPKKWPQVSLSQIIMPPESFIQTGPFGSQLHANEYVVEGTPVVMPQDISTNGIDTSSIARINSRRAAQLSRHRMRVGDIVLARRGDLSKCADINSDQEGWLCGTGCLLLRPPADLSSSWLAALYRHDICQRQIAATAVGTTMINLNTKLVSSLIIPLPPSQEQKRISEVIAAAGTEIVRAILEVEKLRLLKKGLMDDLLTGRVRVGVSE